MGGERLISLTHFHKLKELERLEIVTYMRVETELNLKLKKKLQHSSLYCARCPRQVHLSLKSRIKL